MRLVWDESAWEDYKHWQRADQDYKHWQRADRRILKRISSLIDACLPEPFSGIGKPEQLKYGTQGSWSRRFTDEHRLVYLVDDEDLVILQARYHS